jgi:peptide/nickel transport system substrate-binding protein
MRKYVRISLVLVVFSVLLISCSSPPATEPVDAPAQDVTEAVATVEPAEDVDPRYGGILRVAFEEEPPTFDVHQTTTIVTRVLASHIFEGLFADGADFTPKPLLVDTYESSPDGLSWTFKLREGVLFHNGEELTSEDVVASLLRWGTFGPTGTRTFGFIESIEATDRYIVQLELNEPFGGLLEALSTTRQGALIYPKEVVERLESDGELRPTAEDMIGTGPFRFIEYAPDRHVRLSRFEDYSAREELPDGYAGSRISYVDELHFISIPDSATRLPTLQVGEVHYAQGLPVVDFRNAESDRFVEPLLGAPEYMVLVVNHGGGLLANEPLLRQAILASLDMEEIMRGSVVDEDFRRLDPGVMWQETAWWCDTGGELYNQADPAMAQQLLEEAGYQGEPIRWLVSRDFPYQYDATLIAVDQLRSAGFNIDLEVMDWPTLSQVRFEPEGWEVFQMHSSYRTDAALQSWLTANWANQWGPSNATVDELLTRFSAEVEYDDRLSIWCEVQRLAYEDVPGIKLGDYFPLNGIRVEVENYQNLPEPFFWNVWLED